MGHPITRIAQRRRRQPVLLVLALLTGTAMGCSDAGPGLTAPDVHTLYSKQAALLGPCGEPMVVNLVAGRHVVAGTVTVVNHADGSLSVTYATIDDWRLSEIHLAVVESLVDLPTTRSGNPKIGHFPHTYRSSPPTPLHTVTVPGPFEAGLSLHVLAQAEVVDGLGNTEGAWGDGTRLTERGSKATIFEYEVQACRDPRIKAHYTFDEAAGPILNDVSGNGNTGSIVDATWVQGLNGSALRFDGHGDYVRVSTTLSLEDIGLPGTSWSYEVVFKTQSIPAGNPEAHLLSNYYSIRENDTRFSIQLLQINDGRVFGLARTSRTHEYGVGTSGSVADGRYHHMAIVFDPRTETMRAYLDHVLVGTAGYDASADYSTTDPMHIGAHYWIGRVFGFFTGDIDEVRIAAPALDPEEFLNRGL